MYSVVCKPPERVLSTAESGIDSVTAAKAGAAYSAAGYPYSGPAHNATGTASLATGLAWSVQSQSSNRQARIGPTSGAGPMVAAER